MEFETQAELCEFLVQWLESHGHNTYREIKCPDGGKVDILTQDYAIACRHWLTPEALSEAITELAACEPHIAQHQAVIAGLTPLEPTPEADTTAIADRVAEASLGGIEIWFIDQIEALQAQYSLPESVPAGQPSYEVYEKPRRRRWNPWTGVSVALGMAAILAVSFTLAYRILQEPTVTALSPEQRDAWDRLHDAVAVWDLQTAQQELQDLRRGGNSCVTQFANQLQSALDDQGAEGFRQINTIKRSLNQEGCRLDVIVYDFSP